MYGYKYVPGYWEGLGLRVGLGLRAKFRIECRSVSNCVYAGMTRYSTNTINVQQCSHNQILYKATGNATTAVHKRVSMLSELRAVSALRVLWSAFLCWGGLSSDPVLDWADMPPRERPETLRSSPDEGCEDESSSPVHRTVLVLSRGCRSANG